MKIKHSPRLYLLTWLSLLVFAGLQVTNYLALNPDESGGLFVQTYRNVSNLYRLHITPSHSTSAIWGAIFAWQLAWILYAVVSLHRRTFDGFLYNSPPLLSEGFYVSFINSIITSSIWSFVYNREYLIAATILMFIVSVSLCTCVVISCKALHENGVYLIERSRSPEIHWMQYLVHNGVATYAAWTSIETMQNLGTVLAYRLDTPMSPLLASIACLCVMSLTLLVYTILDMTLLDKYTRNVFMAYVIFVIAIAGICVENWNPKFTTSAYTAVLLGVAILSLCLKSLCMFTRKNQVRFRPIDPIWPPPVYVAMLE